MKLDFVYDSMENRDEIVRTVSAMLIKHFQPNNYYIVSSNFASYNGASLRVELDPQALVEDLMVAKLKFEKLNRMEDFISDIQTHLSFVPKIFANDQGTF